MSSTGVGRSVGTLGGRRTDALVETTHVNAPDLEAGGVVTVQGPD